MIYKLKEAFGNVLLDSLTLIKLPTVNIIIPGSACVKNVNDRNIKDLGSGYLWVLAIGWKGQWIIHENI